jgi:hypothetical protein
LSLDADECLSPELQESILAEKKQGFHFSGYNMNRLNFVKNRPIKGCGWYPDKKLRLFNITQGKWRGKNPHDTFVLDFGLSKQHLKGEIYHYSYNNKGDIFKQAIKFGKIGAKSVRSLNFLVLIYKLIFSPPAKFFRNYFLKLGIIYGLTGLTICLGQASSAAAVILAAGAKGKRYALEHSRILIHQPFAQGDYAQASDIEIQAAEIMRIRLMQE